MLLKPHEVGPTFTG